MHSDMSPPANIPKLSILSLIVGERPICVRRVPIKTEKVYSRQGLGGWVAILAPYTPLGDADLTLTSHPAHLRRVMVNYIAVFLYGIPTVFLEIMTCHSMRGASFSTPLHNQTGHQG